MACKTGIYQGHFFRMYTQCAIDDISFFISHPFTQICKLFPPVGFSPVCICIIGWYMYMRSVVPHTCIHVNPPGSSGSLPEMQPDSCTPGSETELPGCENPKKKKIKKKKKKKQYWFFFLNNFPDHHFCAYVWSLVAGRQLTTRLVWIYKPLTKWHLTLKHHTEKAIKISDDMQWEFIISYLFL